MTKSDLYKEIIPLLADYMAAHNIISAADNTSVQGDVVYGRFEDACDTILAALGNGDFRNVVQYMKDGLTDTNNVVVTSPLRRRTVKVDDRKRLADFSRWHPDVTVITAKAIRGIALHSYVARYYNKRFSVVEMIWLTNKGNAAEMEHLWQTFMGQHQEEYYIFTNRPDNELSDWRQYAYSYFCYVNEGNFERPAELNFTASNKFESNPIPYNAVNNYEQYFDAYNVMSESKFADDILLRYLRMYQILEYFGYRRTLANMTKGNLRENGFVRNIISIATCSSKTESTEIKKGIIDLFTPFVTGPHPLFTAADFTPQRVTFIKDKLFVDNFNYNEGRIWDVIYKLRNCIVHNKEADLHFTYSNTDDYMEGIELMTLFIERIEPEIVKIINDPAITGLEFSRQYEPVY